MYDFSARVIIGVFSYLLLSLFFRDKENRITLPFSTLATKAIKVIFL